MQVQEMEEIFSRLGKSNLPLSDKSRSLMELASGMRSWMTWAPADLSLEETARHQYKRRQRALQTKSCCRGGQTGHRPAHTATVGPPGRRGGAHGCWALTSQLLRSRCRSLMWLLSASPCSNALEKSPKPPYQGKKWGDQHLLWGTLSGPGSVSGMLEKASFPELCLSQPLPSILPPSPEQGPPRLCSPQIHSPQPNLTLRHQLAAWYLLGRRA